MIKQFFVTKLATTQTFDQQGNRLVATQVLAQPLTVLQVKTLASDGYASIQCAIGQKTTKKPKFIREIRVQESDAYKPGDQINLNDVFQPGDRLKAAGLSKGRGFAGVIKRHGFHGGPKTHGQSDRPRSPGSIGMRTTPGRVWKGKKMAGHYGMATKAIRNLQVLKFNETDHILLITGTIPGSRNTLITLTKTKPA
ncbi:MAG: 50S ribosomal protein L3 [Candidatus Beckwithbacteria bacterium]